jgi:acetylornithine deacetylase
MKGGIVCCMIALKALRALGWQPAANLWLQSVVEEECTGNGTLACLERGYRKADLVMIPEPFPQLITAQLGVVSLH